MELPAQHARAEASSPKTGEPHPRSEQAAFLSCVELEVIFTTLALGLSRPESLLSRLPKEIVGHHIARHVRRLYEEDLTGRGLLTPVHLIRPEPSPQQLRAMISQGLAPMKPKPRRLHTGQSLVRTIEPSEVFGESFDSNPRFSGFVALF